MKKILLIASVLLISIILIVLGTFIYILPSPTQIKNYFSKNQIHAEKTISKVFLPNQQDLALNSSIQNAIVNKSDLTDLEDDHVNEQNDSEQKTQETEQKEKVMELVQMMMTEDPSDIRVCENLGNSKLEKATGDQGFEAFTQDNERKDSIAEAYRFPIKAIFQDEQVHNLMSEIMELQKENISDEEKSGFLDKIGFYGRVAQTTAHLYQKRNEIEELANHAYHLSLIAKMSALKPDLANEANMKDACSRLENSIRKNEFKDVTQERTEIMQLMQKNGFSPEQLDFNKDQYIKFNIKSSTDGFFLSLTTDEQ